MTTVRVGQAAEELACSFLKQQGLALVERNWRCKAGELDLIMRDGGTWVFVEVRKRASAAFGGAAASITWDKRRKLQHAAALYLSMRRIDAPCRFDAVLFEGVAPPRWVKNIIA
jgi:putative endonuclease